VILGIPRLEITGGLRENGEESRVCNPITPSTDLGGVSSVSAGPIIDVLDNTA